MAKVCLLNKVVRIYNGAVSNSNDFFLADLRKGTILEHMTAVYKFIMDNVTLSDEDLALLEENVVADSDSDYSEDLHTPIHILDRFSNHSSFKEWYKNISLRCTGNGYIEFIYN